MDIQRHGQHWVQNKEQRQTKHNTESKNKKEQHGPHQKNKKNNRG